MRWKQEQATGGTYKHWPSIEVLSYAGIVLEKPKLSYRWNLQWTSKETRTASTITLALKAWIRKTWDIYWMGTVVKTVDLNKAEVLHTFITLSFTDTVHRP